MASDHKWPLTFVRIRGHWLGLGFGLIIGLGFFIGRARRDGLGAALTVESIAFALLIAIVGYWFWRALDYTGFRVVTRFRRDR